MSLAEKGSNLILARCPHRFYALVGKEIMETLKEGGLVPGSAEPPHEAFLHPRTTYLTKEQFEACKGCPHLNRLLTGKELVISNVMGEAER